MNIQGAPSLAGIVSTAKIDLPNQLLRQFDNLYRWKVNITLGTILNQLRKEITIL